MSNNVILKYINLDKPNKALKESEETPVFMNTWANYNEYGADGGITPTGWMTVDQALEYCKKYAEQEPFINDTDDCPIEISEYDNAVGKLEELKRLEEFDGDQDALKAALEYGLEPDEAIEKIESGDYTFFPGVDNDYDLGAAYVDMVGSIYDAVGDRAEYYFNEDEYKDAIRTDVENMYLEDNNLDEIDDEDAFESYLDDIVSSDMDLILRGEANDTLENYFDYEAFGRDLSFDFTYTKEGAIDLY